MKNLKLFYHKWHKFVDLNSVKILLPPCDNVDEIIATDSKKIFKINTDTEEFTLLFDLNEAIPISDVFIVDFALFSIERILVIATNIGHVLRLDLDSLNEDIICFKKEIKAMQVSPDNELLVFAQSDKTILLTDCRVDILNTLLLEDECFGEGEFMTVGWGKKETQFHGSEGKEAAKKKTTITECDDVFSKDDIVITWRGDAAMFAVGFYIKGICTFKVFNREAVLIFTSEKQPGIECHIVWKPSGSLIATTQQFPNKYVVAFFEKNGLKHGEFTLPFKETDVSIKKLSWSSDSDILSIWYEEISSQKSIVLIYTVKNYHWYLKQTLSFSSERGISAIGWDESDDPTNRKLLHVFLKDGTYSQYNWQWHTHHSLGKTKEDAALVGVLDGNKILLTPFRQLVIPPPMACFTVTCNQNINNLIFGPTFMETDSGNSEINSNSFIAVLDDGSFNFYSYFNANTPLKVLGCALWKETPRVLSTLCHYLWLTIDTILCIFSNGSKSDLFALKICNSSELWSLETLQYISMTDQIIGIDSGGSDGEAILQASSGKLFKFTLLEGLLDINLSFPESCREFRVWYPPHDNSEIFVFGLTNRHRFYVNEESIANNVNSFFVHSDFLILTTLQHQLLSFPLCKDMSRNIRDKFTSISKRNIERGSQLVTVVSCDSRTILQLPRGNIEAIQPRSLSLKLVGDFLDKCQYMKAFNLMRKQRINLNLIYDHNPVTFTKNISSFVSEIKNTTWLSLFISELDNLNVTDTMYKDSYDRAKDNSFSLVGGKVQVVCDLMKEELIRMNKLNVNLLAILTAYVKVKSVSNLEDALLLVKKVQQNPVIDGQNSTISADEALKHLLYLINVDELYDIALGLYDFDLVMFIARKSQKDPKEYVPFLNTLKEMQVDYRKFTINKHLKRYELALESLVQCGKEKEEELFSFIKLHNLYRSALRLIAKEDPVYRRCAFDYAEYLVKRKKYMEAGIMYKRSCDYSKSIECFIEAMDWQSAMQLVNENYATETGHSSIIEKKILEKLKDNMMYSEMLEFMQFCDTTSAKDQLEVAIDGGFYRKALFICINLIDKHPDRHDSMVKLESAIMKQYESLMTTIEENCELFLKQKERILIVRQTKLEIQEHGGDYNEDCDLFSDTSSMAPSNITRTSGHSMRSSKNRRKHQRKLISLKEGSRYEDVALVRALHTLVHSTFHLRKDLAEVTFVLQWFDKDEDVIRLQTSLEQCLDKMRMSFPEIWTAELASGLGVATIKNTHQDHEVSQEEDPQSTLEPHLRIAPVIQDIKWKIEQL